ncbi:MAG TPA: hypothetical protein VL993_02395 [Stellaceae bacterium]|nr:hypothetical protein [Stellaceae bacterium]
MIAKRDGSRIGWPIGRRRLLTWLCALPVCGMMRRLPVETPAAAFFADGTGFREPASRADARFQP